MILQKQPSKPWDKYDFLLLEAYQILEEERCPQCGLPQWICHNEDEDIQIELRDDTCFVKRTEQEADAINAKITNYKTPLGTVVQPHPKTYSGKALDWRVREQYYLATNPPA
jgi:hypothetical protein